MIDFNKGNYETAGGRSDRQRVNSLPFSRRSFLAKTSYFGALYAAAKLLPMPALAAAYTALCSASEYVGPPKLIEMMLAPCWIAKSIP